MACGGGTADESVELTDRSQPTPDISTSSDTPLEPSQVTDVDEGGESDADEDVFHDALETLTTSRQRQSFSLNKTLEFFRSNKSSFRKWIHVFYAAAMVIGMTMGLIFTYLQWRQQALANELSKMQTCTEASRRRILIHNPLTTSYRLPIRVLPRLSALTCSSLKLRLLGFYQEATTPARSPYCCQLVR